MNKSNSMVGYFLFVFLLVGGGIPAFQPGVEVYFEPGSGPTFPELKQKAPENSASFAIKKYCYLNRVVLPVEVTVELDKLGPDQEVSVFEIREYLRSGGLKSNAYEIDQDAMAQIESDFICHFKGGHFALVRPYKGRLYVYEDTRFRVKKLTLSELWEQASGFVIAIGEGVDQLSQPMLSTDCSFEFVMINEAEPSKTPYKLCQTDNGFGVCLKIDSPLGDLKIEDAYSSDVSIRSSNLPIEIKKETSEDLWLLFDMSPETLSVKLHLFNSRKEEMTVHLYLPEDIAPCPCMGTQE